MSFSRSLVFSSIIIALSLAYPSVNADEYLDEDIEESLEDFYGDEDFISIATGTKQLIRKAPSVATVITAQDIKSMGARNLVDVLDTVPGLHASRSGQNYSPEFWFRGISTTYTPQTLFMINNTSTKSSVRGDNHIIWGEFPIHAIERIEIIRGPGSALYGADAFSGVINVVTKKNNEQFNNEVGAKIGKFNTKNVWANSGFTLGSWQFSANFEYLASDGFEQKITSDAQTIIDQFGATFNTPPASLAPANIEVSFKSLDMWLSSENTFFNVELGLQDRSNIGTGQGPTETLDSYGRGAGYKKLASLTLKEQKLSDEFHIGGKLSYYASSQEIEKDFKLFPPRAFFGAFPDGFIGNPGWEEETTHLELNSRFSGFDKADVKIGIGYERQNVYKVVEEKNFLPDLTPRPNGLEDVSDTSEVYMPEADRENHYIYLQGVTQLAPDWELTVGARYDDYTDFGSTFNPRLALVWSTSLNLTSKLLYGKAFRAPSFAELIVTNNPVSLGNPQLTPEHIDTIELAFDYKYSPDLSINFNLYHYQIDDLISFVQDTNNVTATAQNQGKRTGNGFEAGIIFDANDNLTIHSNIAFAKADDDIADQDVGEYPGIQAYLRAEWSLNEYLKVNSQISYIGDRERVPGDTRETIDDYTLVNISTRYMFTNNIELELMFSNIFDEDIREPSSAGTTFGQINIPNDIPQAGRSFNIALTKTF